MAPKRKRTRSINLQSSKRKKTTSTADEAENSPLWKARGIIDEKKGRYLIAWEGKDPATGEDYVPTWEPKDSPTPDLVEQWEQEKKQRQQQKEKEKAAKTGRPAQRHTQPREPASKPKQTILRLKLKEPSATPFTTSWVEETPVNHSNSVEHIFETDTPCVINTPTDLTPRTPRNQRFIPSSLGESGSISSPERDLEAADDFEPPVAFVTETPAQTDAADPARCCSNSPQSLFNLAQPLKGSPIVFVDPGSQFNRNDFDIVSSQILSQIHPTSSQSASHCRTQLTDHSRSLPDSPPHTESQSELTTSSPIPVIPDTQSLPGSTSYVPSAPDTTQTQTQTPTSTPTQINSSLESFHTQVQTQVPGVPDFDPIVDDDITAPQTDSVSVSDFEVIARDTIAYRSTAPLDRNNLSALELSSSSQYPTASSQLQQVPLVSDPVHSSTTTISSEQHKVVNTIEQPVINAVPPRIGPIHQEAIRRSREKRTYTPPAMAEPPSPDAPPSPLMLKKPEEGRSDYLSGISEMRKAHAERRRKARDESEIATSIAQVSHISPVEPDTRSPSTIPNIMPSSHPQPQTLLRTAVHVEDLGEPSGLGDVVNTQEAYESNLLEDPTIRAREFLIPIAADANTADVYKKTFKHYELEITNFLKRPFTEEHSAVQRIEKLLGELRNILTAGDLNMDLGREQSEMPAHLAQYWETHSPKFRFLHRVIERCRDHRIHIAILSRPGSVLDALETYLRGKNVHYVRPGAEKPAGVSEGEGELSITLLPTGEDGSKVLVRPADLVLCWDNSYDVANNLMMSLRTSIHGDLPPVVALVVIRSIEHVERCIASHVVGVHKVRLMLQCAVDLRDLLTPDLEDRRYNPTNAAELLSEALKAKPDGGVAELLTGEFPHLEGISDLVADIDDIDGSTPSELSVTSSAPQGTQIPTATKKRSLEVNDDDEVGKKMRMTLPQSQDYRGGDASASYLDDSAEPRQASPDRNAQHATHALLPPEEDSDSDAGRNASLAARLASSMSRVKELERSMDALQTRSEEMSSTNAKHRAENKQLRKDLEHAKQREERQSELNNANAERIIHLTQKLAEANAALKLSGDPLQKKLAEFRDGMSLAEEAQKKTERQLRAEQNSLEYLRAQYQDVGEQATQNASRVKELEMKVKELEPKASENAIRIRNISHSTQMERQKLQYDQLRMLNENMTRSLKRKDERIKALENGRSGVGTRNASVPRSPRLGALPGSRGASPMPGTGVGGRVSTLRNG